jgi:citrate lyase synthetase
MENIKRPFAISQRILQEHCQSPTSQRYNQSFVKELAKPTQGKIELKKISFPSKNKKYAIAQTNTTKTMTETQQGQWFTDTEDRTPAPNITYTQAGVSCFVRQESGKFEVQFFVGNSVVKIPACV